jgi:hypothetical protein
MRLGLTVFLCSTYSDLSGEREAVLNAIRQLQLQHDSMEFFGVRAGQLIETCLAEVYGSNILVVIAGPFKAAVGQGGLRFRRSRLSEVLNQHPEGAGRCKETTDHRGRSSGNL